MKAAIKHFALIAFAPFLLASGDPSTATEHVVKEGETLGGIANRAGVDKNLIAVANGLREPYKVRVGQKLVIPRQRSHKVKSGETGRGIANRFGIPFTTLAVANSLEPPYKIRVGQVLIIPAVFKAPPPSTGSAPTSPYFRRPHDGRVMAGFAKRADGGGHDGLDIEAKLGDMVRASASGTVEFAGSEPKRFGRMVVIDHGMGYKSVYGHLSRITVTKGEYVKAGERIGLAGQAGIATKPELHFEIRKDGKHIDPAGKLPAR